MNIVITGASGGVGSYLAKHFDKADKKLFLTYNQSSIPYHPELAKYEAYKCDFINEDDVKDFYNSIPEINVLINSMGEVDNALVKNMSMKAWTAIINSNLTSVFLSCRCALPKMPENSHIINISSILGTTGMVGATNYSTAKGGVEAFTRSLALEAIRNRVFANAIALGYFETGLGLKLSDKIRKIVTKQILLKKFGDPREIGSLVDYIISSRYLVGQVIHLNGGFRV